MKGKYKLSLEELVVRVRGETFKLKKGDTIRVADIDQGHGDVLIDYGDSLFAWKHASVLKNFERT